MMHRRIMLVGLLGLVGPLQAQDALLSRSDVKVAMDYLVQNQETHFQRQIRIAQIPAPPFEEKDRAAFMAAEFRRLGLKNVEMDAVGNVLGWRPGKSESTFVVAAHLDTVFPPGTDVSVKQAGKRWTGPGLGDDSRGLTTLLALVEAINHASLRTEHSLLFVADVGEEGLGNLRGTKYLFQEGQYRDRLKAFVSIDGTHVGSISIAAVGSRRYCIVVKGPGGHSYGDFGRVNPAHALGRIMARLGTLEVPDNPKTTYNIGRMGGGTSVNAIPFENWIEVDMRSESAAELKKLEGKLLEVVRQGVEEENRFREKSGTQLQVEAKLVGDRPVATQSKDSDLILAAQWATRAIGTEPRLVFGSNDAAVPIWMGLPGIALGGGGKGGNTHSLEEWFEPEEAYKGVQRILLTLLAFEARSTAATGPHP